MEISTTKNSMETTSIIILIIWDPVLIKSHKSHLPITMVPVKSYGASTSTFVSPCCGVKSPDLTTWEVWLKGKAGRFPQTAIGTPVYRGMTAEDLQYTRSSAKGNTVEEGRPWLNPSSSLLGTQRWARSFGNLHPTAPML